MAASHGSGPQSPPSIGRPVDRVFDEAQFTGEIILNGRKLRDFPKICNKYDLSDTVHVDLSRNRLSDVPGEVCSYIYVERLNCYHNVIRSIPDAIAQLQALTHLNLSRNQLTVLPPALCMLTSLEVLFASNNKLVSLPEEIGHLENLMDLDVSCNEISHLPLQIGDLSSLRSLNLRRNFLVELPVEISRLHLYKLDFSSNRIEKIPTVFRKMETLQLLIQANNPLSSPPAYICTKGKQHIMKYLHIESIKEDRKRGIMASNDFDLKRITRKSLPPQSSEELRMLGGQDKWKRHTVLSNDSGYSTGDGEKNGWHSGEELKRQKADYERRKKEAEEIRAKQLQLDEIEREKEDCRRAAIKLQEEQKKQEEMRRQEELKRQEELRMAEESRRCREAEEEEARKREEEVRKLQEAVRLREAEEAMEKQRQAEEIHKEAEESKKNKLSSNYYNQSHSNNRSHYQHPSQPPPNPPSSSTHKYANSRSLPPKPPSSLAVHGVTSQIPVSHQRESPQQDKEYILSENEYRNALSSQSFKEQNRRLANSTQYRRTASDGLKKTTPSPASQVEAMNHINKKAHTRSYTGSISYLARPTNSHNNSSSPHSSTSHLAKPSASSSTSSLSSPSSSSHHHHSSNLAKPVSSLTKPSGGKSSAMPRASPSTNGQDRTTSTLGGQNQVVRRTKLAGDRSNTSSPTTARSARTAQGSTGLRPTGGGGGGSSNSLAPGSGPSNIRRSSNSSTTDDERGNSNKSNTPTSVGTSRLKSSRLEEPKQRGVSAQNTGVRKLATPDNDNKRINAKPPTSTYGSNRTRTAPRGSDDGSTTIRNKEDYHREEGEQMDRLRQTVEARLKVTLPDNLAEALRDGVVLCHLANQIRPRSVGSIHVPSPAVPKLTLAKCRRNVDNFLEACRKIGIGQEQICNAQDVLEERGISRVAITVAALVAIGTNPKQSAV